MCDQLSVSYVTLILRLTFYKSAGHDNFGLYSKRSDHVFFLCLLCTEFINNQGPDWIGTVTRTDGKKSTMKYVICMTMITNDFG